MSNNSYNFPIKKTLPKWYFPVLVIAVLLYFIILQGKRGIGTEIVSFAVSENEQYVACNMSNGTILCWDADGTELFEYDAPSEISKGGTCYLSFSGDKLLVYFYRSGLLATFSMNGTLLDIRDAYPEEKPTNEAYVKKRYQEFQGDKISVVYDNENLLGYVLFGKERTLTIISQNEKHIIWRATAKNGWVD